jgi:DNA-binding NarL/FixJ family response regulator
MIRVLVVSGIRLYREGLTHIMRADGRLEVVGVAATADEALSELDSLGPDVILLDMTTIADLAEVAAFTERCRVTKVVALGVVSNEREVVACAEAGVAGYVLREDTLEQLVRAIESATRNELSCAPWTAAALLRRLATLATRQPSRPDEPRMTRREREILEFLDRGLSNKEIAVRLGVELSTVKNHVHSVIQKLGVHRRGEAAAMSRGGRSGQS